MRVAVVGWTSLWCIALFACGGSSGSSDSAERSGDTAVVAAARTLTCSSLQVESGSIGSGQTVQGLHTQTLSGTQDRWTEYVEFFPGTSATCTFALPSDVGAADILAAEVGINYRGPATSQMRWLFEAWDYVAGAWVLVGDNAFAQSWRWTATSLELTSPQRFVSGGPVQVRYRTTSTADAALLDLLVVRIQVAASDAGTSSDAGTGTDAGTPVSWEGVQSFTYQLTNYPQGKLDTIANSKFDLAIVDLARDGYVNWFTAAEITALKASGKQVLAYFEIGAIENYRPEWSQVPDDLKLGPVGGWPNEQYVKYWDERWWPIVQGRIDQALAAGFNGCYLDMVVTYEEIPANSAGTNRADLARKMVALLERINQYAKARNPAFKVMPQNSPELVDDPAYLPAIDGLGMEDMYWSDDNPCDMGWCEENRTNAARVRAAGKLVLSTDYAVQAAHVADAYTRSRAAGFVPYVSVRALDRMTVNAGWDPQ